MQVAIKILPKGLVVDEGHNYVDITKAVSRNGFPRQFSQSLKGDAYFDFTVKGFSFRMIKTHFNKYMFDAGYTLFYHDTDFQIRLQRYASIIIVDKGTDEILGRGFVDEIEDWNDSEPRIKYMPDATRLKDIKAGVKTSDEDDEDEIWEFEIDHPTNVRDIVQSLISNMNDTIAEGEQKNPLPFSATIDSIPEPEGAQGIRRRWLGTVLHKMKKTGLSFNLAKMFIDAFDASYFRRKANSGQPSGYDWFYEVQDAGVIKRILISQGQWLHIWEGQWMSWSFNTVTGIHLSTLRFTFDYPCGVSLTWFAISLDWCSITFNLGHVIPTIEWGEVTWTIPSTTIDIPSSHIYIPCIGSRHDLYSLNGGDMVQEQSWVKSVFPIIDDQFHQADHDGDEEGGDIQVPNLGTLYGSRWDNEGDSANVTQAKVKVFVKDEGSNWQLSRSAFDWDDQNTYFIVKTKKRWNDIGGSEWLVGMETPFDFYQRLHYKNATPAKVLKDLCVVTNRFLYIDKNNLISMMEREPISVPFHINEMPRHWFVSRKTKIKRDVETQISIDRYKRDSEGKVSDWGIVLRETEWEFLQSFYKDKFSGNVTTNTLEILKPSDLNQTGIDMPQLLDLLYMDDNGSMTKLGTVIQVDIGMEHSKYKYVAQFTSEAGEA
jgi:hypothetical protein